MEGRFDVVADPRRDLIRTRLSGFFDQDALQRYLQARAAAFARLRCGPNQHLSVTDVSDMKIQAQDMVAAFAGVLADPAHRSKRLAFVVATSLARQQLRRALGSRIDGSVRFFIDAGLAERWVLTGEEQNEAA